MTDFTIVKGSTFSPSLQWEDDLVVWKPISAITKAAPCVITASLHGLPAGWRVAVQSVQGMKQINAQNTTATSEVIKVYNDFKGFGFVVKNGAIVVIGVSALVTAVIFLTGVKIHIGA